MLMGVTSVWGNKKTVLAVIFMSLFDSIQKCICLLWFGRHSGFAHWVSLFSPNISYYPPGQELESPTAVKSKGKNLVTEELLNAGH